MDDANLLRWTEGFLAALRLKENTTRFLKDRRFFATLVEELRPARNHFALHFQTYSTLSGKDCPDFERGLSIAHMAGMVVHITGPSATYSIELSPRRAVYTLARLEPEEHHDLLAFVKKYAVECRVS